jgi:UDP-N-acetylglucosamine transferase subunit ALG13
MEHIWPGMFARARVPPMLADLTPVVEHWRPDLIVHDSAELAGAILAEVVGIPHAEHSFGILRPRRARQLATDAIAAFCDDLHVANPGVGGLNGELYLDVCPPGIQSPDIAELVNVMSMRPAKIDAPTDTAFAAWIGSRRARPMIYVTMGTVFSDVVVFQQVLDGLARSSFDVVVTVGKAGNPAELRVRSDNVYIDRYIPQAQVLRHADVMVCHAGSGALLGVLNQAVPMLAIPRGADQFMNAGRVVETGIGLALLPDEVTSEAVLSQVHRLLDDARFKAIGRSFMREIRGMPAPEVVAKRLEGVVARSVAEIGEGSDD